jgi:predicted phosphoribosyltransferase
MPDRLFRDRRDAGRVLTGLLGHYRDRDDVVVLALPRGGMPVGCGGRGRLARRLPGKPAT